MEADPITEYNDFLRDNRIKVNRYLNTVLWFFVLTGPAIAAGIKRRDIQGYNLSHLYKHICGGHYPVSRSSDTVH